MKLRHLLLAGGLVGSTLIAAFGNRDRTGEVVSPSRTDAASSAPASHHETQSPSASIDGLTHTDVARIKSRADLATGDKHDADREKVLFAVHSWAPPAPASSVQQQPTAPPLPFLYLGKEFDGREWRVFLARQSAVFIVKADDVIEDTYRIAKISPPIMTVLYIPLNESQQLSIQ